MRMTFKFTETSKPATGSKSKTGRVVVFGSTVTSGPIAVFESKTAVELIDASIIVTFQSTATFEPSAASDSKVAVELA